MHGRSKVAKPYEWFASGVGHGDTARGRLVADENFIFGVLAESNHGWRLESQLSDRSFALNGDPTASTWVFKNAFLTGLDGEFLGGE